VHIDIITVLPDLLQSPLQHSIMLRAQKKGLVSIDVHDLRVHGLGKSRKLDDYSFGGNAGMVLMIEPIANCISDLKKKRDYDEIIYLTPDGETFNQSIANQLSLKGNLIFLCGHYKGIDERIREHFITKELSIGDYVLTGGELAALVISDAICRLIPGVISDETSALTDSFQDGLLAPPVYTRPADYNGWKVPEVLTKGNFPKIEEWNEQQAYKRTLQRRPDLLNNDETETE